MYKKYYQKFLSVNLGKQHYAAHSHHYWPDVTFEATVQLDADDVDIGKGLRLVLEGRVARWSTGGETVLCRAAQAYERPLCLVSAKLDLIAVENASNGDRLADWRF